MVRSQDDLRRLCGCNGARSCSSRDLRACWGDSSGRKAKSEEETSAEFQGEVSELQNLWASPITVWQDISSRGARENSTGRKYIGSQNTRRSRRQQQPAH
ncbi:hypothetical protein VZT92_003547 [Zoarces viviparus]